MPEGQPKKGSGMALTTCRECTNKVSTQAILCPHCGALLKKNGAVGNKIMLAAVGVVVAIWGISSLLPPSRQDPAGVAIESQSPAASSSVVAPQAVNIPQLAFELIRTSKLDAYDSAKNEIQKSAVFNQANVETAGMLAQYGDHFAGWMGTIGAITTSHGGKDVSVKIQSPNGVLYRIYDDAPAGSSIYMQLASLQVGQAVVFAGRIKKRALSRDSWEDSLTERGSLSDPEFLVQFDSIEAHGIRAAAPARPPIDAPAADALTQSATPAPAMRRPSFDCNRAKSVPELLICGDDELASLDVELSGLLAQARQEASDKKRLAEETRTAWNWREKNCRDKECLLQWYAERKSAYLATLQEPQQQSQKSQEQRDEQREDAI